MLSKMHENLPKAIPRGGTTGGGLGICAPIPPPVYPPTHTHTQTKALSVVKVIYAFIWGNIKFNDCLSVIVCIMIEVVCTGITCILLVPFVCELYFCPLMKISLPLICPHPSTHPQKAEFVAATARSSFLLPSFPCCAKFSRELSKK